MFLQARSENNGEDRNRYYDDPSREQRIGDWERTKIEKFFGSERNVHCDYFLEFSP